jgi:pimeloyl-ACP methyl ester carboxylesterase
VLTITSPRPSDSFAPECDGYAAVCCPHGPAVAPSQTDTSRRTGGPRIGAQTSGDTITTVTAHRVTPPGSSRIELACGSIAYTTAGSGEPLLLVHGLGGTRHTWRHLIDMLAATHTVIAPDLPGHGDSDAPGGDYSLGAHATALRDLLVALGHTHATIVGHSLGGGIGLQFAYQFPERTDRLILISSGGLGPQLNPILRAATLPAAQIAVAGLARLPRRLTGLLLPALSVLPGLIARQDARVVTDALHALADPRQRRTFIRTARTVIDWRGQTVRASGHLGPLEHLPVLLAWGANDRTIPPRHHYDFARRLPAPHLVEIADAGHFPHETAPQRLLPPLQAFLASTQPFRPAQVGSAPENPRPSDWTPSLKARPAEGEPQ